MTSYLRYKKELRTVQDADDIESWITVRGNHIPIKKGQSKEDAVKSFLKSKGGNSSTKGSEQKNELSIAYHKDKGHIKEGNPPKGWTKVEGATTAPNGYSWYSNNKSMFGGERESYLYKDKPESSEKERKLSNGGSTLGLTQKEHNKIEKHNEKVGKIAAQYKAEGKKASEFIQKLEKKDPAAVKKFVESVEKTWGKNSKEAQKAREKYGIKEVIKPESAQYRLIVKNGKISDILEYNKDLKDWYKDNEAGFFKQYLNKDPEFVKKELLRHLTTLKSKEILIEKNEESSKKWSGAWSKRANKPESLGNAAKNATSISKMTKMSASERDEEVGFPMLEIAYNDVEFSADPAKNRSALSKAIKESGHENADLMKTVLANLSDNELKDADAVRKGIRDYMKSYKKKKATDSWHKLWGKK
jgi:hypothetical protein